MSLFDRFIDHSPDLRCSSSEAIGSITAKAFVKDAGFGDCPMQITYEFLDDKGLRVCGRHVGTESSFSGVKIGDRIRIRYLKSNPKRNAPTDSLGIINPVVDGAK